LTQEPGIVLKWQRKTGVVKNGFQSSPNGLYFVEVKKKRKLMTTGIAQNPSNGKFCTEYRLTINILTK